MLSPMKEMKAVLEGRLSYHDASPAVQSCLRLPIHKMAIEAIKSTPAKNIPNYACKWPETVRQEVIARARELWKQGIRS